MKLVRSTNLCWSLEVSFHLISDYKKHDGHASRKIGGAMKHNGVDEKVYHSGSIDGNKCIKFGENGTKIVEAVTRDMKKVIKNDENVKYLNKLDSILRELLSVWYRGL